ncbi:MAG: hypothetical protein Q9227_001131 [Pyrenula ochraceoflavens]
MLKDSKRKLFSNRISVDNITTSPKTLLSAARSNGIDRPLSALARPCLRNLSEIREASHSSGCEPIKKGIAKQFDGVHDGQCSSTDEQSQPEQTSSSDIVPKRRSHATRRTTDSRAGSVRSLPIRNVPERRSSATALHHGTQSAVKDYSSKQSGTRASTSNIVPCRGRSISPLRKILDRDPVSSITIRRPPSKTLVRTVPPLEILNTPTSCHPRVDMSVILPASLFVGGGTVEGHIKLDVDTAPLRKTRPVPLFISRLSVDLVGVEETADGRRWAFLSLASEMIDADHPPPFDLVESLSPLPDTSWPLKPSSVKLPFCLNLPLNVGPPPYNSKQVRIRYVLAATAIIISAGETGKANVVRHSYPIQLLTVHDPEKALASLPHPLLAADSASLPLTMLGPKIIGSMHHPIIKLTAGLHRQIWVSGTQIFVDLHVVNGHPSKYLTKIDLSLEKSTMLYLHAAAGTAQKSASHLRLPSRTDSEIVARAIHKANTSSAISRSCSTSPEWRGVPPSGGTEIRTLAIEAPRNCVTVSSGRYFEVRFFLNASVSIPSSGMGIFHKTLAVQLPVTLIHMNSLDIVPNSLAQVAAAIEEKRQRTVPIQDDGEVRQYPPYHQGQAWTAPRRVSVEMMQDQARRQASANALLENLTRELERSPRRTTSRKTKHHHTSSHMATQQDNTDPNEEVLHQGDCCPACDSGAEGNKSQPERTRSRSHSHQHGHSHDQPVNPLPPHSHPIDSIHRPSSRAAHHTRNKSSTSTNNPNLNKPRIPRLQLSTSGLGFSDTEFSLEADSPPRKVMLSEEDRKRIVQARELRLARMRSRMMRELESERMKKEKVLRKNAKRGGAGGWIGAERTSMPTNMPMTGQMTPPPSWYAPIGNHPWGWRNVAAEAPPPSMRRRRDKTGTGLGHLSGPGMPKGSATAWEIDRERERERERIMRRTEEDDRWDRIRSPRQKLNQVHWGKERVGRPRASTRGSEESGSAVATAAAVGAGSVGRKVSTRRRRVGDADYEFKNW